MTFGERIQSDQPVLVDFFAEWCGPCKTMAPILQDVKRKVGDSVSIIKVDIDKNQQVAAQYQITSVPTLILFKKGSVKWRHSGLVAPGDLTRILEQNR